MVTWFVPGKPVPQGSKRWLPGGRMIEANKDLRPWRAVVTAYTRAEMVRAQVALIDEPVMLTATFYLPRSKAHYGTGRNSGKLKPGAPTFVATTPDLDKLVRAVQDGVTDAGMWKDDSLVVSLHADKLYAEQPGVLIGVHTMKSLEGKENDDEENSAMAGPLPDAELQLDF